VTNFYIETPCLTHGAASGSAATWKLNSYEAESVGDAIEMAAQFWETNGYQVVGHSRDVTESVLATRKAKTT